jgi:hypothetical protein
MTRFECLHEVVHLFRNTAQEWRSGGKLLSAREPLAIKIYYVVMLLQCHMSIIRDDDDITELPVAV